MSLIEIAQPDFTRKVSTADGTVRTLCRIDRAFISLPMAEARDFHCYYHVFENLGGKRSIPSDHAAVRVVKNRQFGATRANAFRVGCPNITFSAQS